ncbi:hypothetical protein L1049_009774 [Liquidambar formosana]|uniref:Alpha N-terminal protein methyltransferase 1 n=1 Tax=Liquidambar formosana TaxID=63359 RepID=A0AAP0N911_LIQFO
MSCGRFCLLRKSSNIAASNHSQRILRFVGLQYTNIVANKRLRMGVLFDLPLDVISSGIVLKLVQDESGFKYLGRLRSSWWFFYKLAIPGEVWKEVNLSKSLCFSVIEPGSYGWLVETSAAVGNVDALFLSGIGHEIRYYDLPIVSYCCSTKPRCTDPMEAGGLDSDGREFKNAEEMWRGEIGGDPHKKTEWYRQGVGYWEGVEASVDGVLGGYGQVNEADVKGSEAFLNTLLSERFVNAGRNQHLVALDCGSGIGRVTKNLLIRYFNEVDLLEPVSHFLDTARGNLAPENLMVSDRHKATNFFCLPLQEFTPDAGRYDVIWIQWCIGHLADDDFVSFFKRAKIGLKPGGFFVLKENIARTGFVLDKEDRSITRSDLYFKELFGRCGLHLYKSKDQRGFPEGLFAVKIYALTTDMPKRVHATRSKVKANRPGIIK